MITHYIKKTKSAPGAVYNPYSKSYTLPAKKVKKSKKDKKKDKKKKGKTAIKDIKKQISTINKELKEGQTTLRYRSRSTSSIIADYDSVTHYTSSFDYGSIAYVLQRLQYWDETTGNFITRNFFDGTNSRSIRMKYASIMVEFKNNYQVPVEVTAYLATPRVDSNDGVVAAFNANVGQNMVGVTTPVAPFNPLVHLTDSDNVNSFYHIKKMKSFSLEPGRNGSAFHAVEDIEVPRLGQTTLMQKALKTFQIILRVEGGAKGLVHQADNANNVGYGKCGIDYASHFKATVEYEGGQTAERILVEMSKNITSGVLTVNPFVDNIPFSIS